MLYFYTCCLLFLYVFRCLHVQRNIESEIFYKMNAQLQLQFFLNLWVALKQAATHFPYRTRLNGIVHFVWVCKLISTYKHWIERNFSWTLATRHTGSNTVSKAIVYSFFSFLSLLLLLLHSVALFRSFFIYSANVMQRCTKWWKRPASLSQLACTRQI